VIAHALVQRLFVARSDLRCAHERAALDGCDALTNLMTPTTPPIHPFPSAAPTAPGSTLATTMHSTTHRSPPPSAAPTAPGSAISTTTSTASTTEGASPPTNHATHPFDLPPPFDLARIPGPARTAPDPTYLPPTRTSKGAPTTTRPTFTNPSNDRRPMGRCNCR
jgi:hypothetical protein